MNNIKQVLQNWGLGDVAAIPIDSPSQSTWDVGGKYILKKQNSNTDELSHSMQISKHLISKKIPVATYIPAVDGHFTSPDGLYCLMTKLPGKKADFYKEPHLALAMGCELARLHTALTLIENEIPYKDSDLLADWHNRIKPSCDDLVSNNILENVDAAFREGYPKLPRQLIHRDVHHHNVLFDGERLTGWLDFDISQQNVRIFDIAYLLAGQLLGELQDFEKIKIWRSVYGNLLLGYDEINPLSGDERDTLSVLMIVIEFLFVCFWNGRGNIEQRDRALELAKWMYNEYLRERN